MPTEASPMSSRPPVRMICYYSAEGNPHQFVAGAGGITELREVQECSEFCYIPWIEVWAGDQLRARFNQHKLEHIFYAS